MGVHDTNSDLAKSLAGVHLFHFFMSNCSQRVRFALEEKGVRWTSHHLNLPAREHLNEQYRSINPNAVVPTLVHDGRVIIESNDIITYIDETFEGPALSAQTTAAKDILDDLLGMSSNIQSAIKVISHEMLFKPVRKVSGDDVRAMEAEGARADLVQFMRDFSEDGEAWAHRFTVACEEMNASLQELERQLADTGEWLSGAWFGLADISWSVNAWRLRQARYNTAIYPLLEKWQERVFGRAAFQSAVANYTPA